MYEEPLERNVEYNLDFMNQYEPKLNLLAYFSVDPQ
jgi:hypothetical protein